MKPITIYTTPFCGFCVAAKRLLKKKNADFTEIDVSRDKEKRQEMMQKSGQHTVPQIWIGETHVGGCDELHELERAGKLDPLLAA